MNGLFICIMNCLHLVSEHISTELMIADPSTKGMPPLKFKDHVMNMGLSSLM